MLPLPLVNLWKERSLIFYFSWINIKRKFKKTSFGLILAGIIPIIGFIFFYVLFRSIGISFKEEFAMYLLVGIVFFNLFQLGTMSGLTSIIANRMILRSRKINSELFPVVSTGTTAIFSLIGIGVIFLFPPIFHHQISWSWALLPLVMLLLLGLILGLSYVFSIIYYFFKSAKYFWQFFVFALFFLTPIFWYIDEANGFALIFHQVNPLGQLIEIAHKLILNETSSLGDWIYATLLVGIILVLGYLFFKKFEKKALERM